MKPKNKYQEKIVELHKSIKDNSKDYIDFISQRTFKKYVNHRKTDYCLECGNSFPNDGTQKEKTCPHCGNEIKHTEFNKYYQSYNSGYDDYYHLIKLEVHFDFQVVRIFEYHRFLKKKEKPVYISRESQRYFIDQKGKITNFGYYNIYGNNIAGGFELRSAAYDYSSLANKFVYTKNETLEIIKRNGFSLKKHKSFIRKNIHVFFKNLLSNPKVETILKANSNFINFHDNDFINYHWNTIKICLRNNYNPVDLDIYRDHINMLSREGYDVLNLKYVCPNDLLTEHQELIRKIQIKKDKINMRDAQINYDKTHKKFFDFKISNDVIVIEPFKTIKQFKDDGLHFNHCVYSSRYYEHKNSLLLRAVKDEIPVATIEYDLLKNQIIQCRGYDNNDTPYNHMIFEMIESKKNLISKLKKSKQR